TPPERDSAVEAHTLLATPFAEREPRPKGAYLHWALPDALTNGIASATSPDVKFPAVPDRWLVVRLSTGGDESRRAVTAWVIEAGDEDPKVTPLDQWTETTDPDRTDTPGEQPLTALGHGDAVWSAYFDNVQNRLGFYDDLKDVTGPLAYLVCGWHSRNVDDPIGESLTSPTMFEQRLAQLGWEINTADIEAAFVYAQDRIETATKLGFATREARFSVHEDAAIGKSLISDGIAGEAKTQFDAAGLAEFGRFFARAVSWPEFTLYHGSVVGIGWPDVGFEVAPKGLLGGEVGGPPAASAVTVCVGNTIPEALATHLAHNHGHPDEARILEAVLLGGSEELDQPDSAARIDVRTHASGFGSLPGGEITETLRQHLSKPPTSVVADPSKTDRGVFPPPPAPPRPPKSTFGDTKGELVSQVGIAPFEQITPTLGRGLKDSVLVELKERAFTDIVVKVPKPADNAEPPEEAISVQRSLPRFFIPADPVFLLQGAGRSFKHGADALHAESNKLVCRMSGHTVTALSPRTLTNLPGGGSVNGADLLARAIGHGGVPVECNDLLREVALLDPGSSSVAVRASTRGARRVGVRAANTAAQTFAVEQVAWWVTRDERRDSAHVIAASGFVGTLPNPIAVSVPAQPWTPLHLDWEVELFAAPDFAAWQLEEIDYDAVTERIPALYAGPVRTLRGRALLGGGAAQVAAATVRKVLEQAQQTAGSQALSPGSRFAYHSQAALEMVRDISLMSTSQRMSTTRPERRAAPAAGTQSELDHIADELERMDVLVGAMDRFNTLLRAGFTADGVATPAGGDAVPVDFWPLRSGFMRVTRLRLVDCFGQTLDLAGSDADTPAKMADILRSEPLTVENRLDLLELAPRFTAPSRLWFRFVAASDDATEAGDGASPVCGFVLPNHLDGDLQFHDAGGLGIGAVRFDGTTTKVVWEDSPGQPTTIGKSPSVAVDNHHLGGIAQGLLDWGTVDATPDHPAVDTALSSLLRIVDATLWSVDPFAHIGEEHLGLLVGHPIAVLRAKVKVEVNEPVTPAVVQGIRVPVRIGALAHWQDGLLAYFVGDDYHTLHIPDSAAAEFARPIGPHEGFKQQANSTSDYYTNFAADLGIVAQPGATPVDHPYVDTSGLVWIQPGQEVMLTLLMEPHSVVHATTGFLPRKDIGMRREWVAPGLSKLAPIFRFGPVLVDPKLIRMPIAADIRGTWSWSHRANATAWLDEPVTNSTGDARIPPDPSQGQEGWLKLTPEQPASGG
ncbi:MAG TPA: hypothetical protein VGA62_01375, partial [Acidimicrobiia bacterium]